MKINSGGRAPTINALDEGWLAFKVMTEKIKIGQVMDELTRIGAIDILVLDVAHARAA